MMRNVLLLAPVVLAACSSSESVQWVEGIGFEWDLFNHRLSYAEVGISGDNAQAVIVGGTSTTGVDTELPLECDPDETDGALPCDEFPFLDTAFVDVATGQMQGRQVASGTAQVTLLADAEGVSGQVTVSMSRRPRGDVIALIQGLRLDTDAPLSGGTSCYDPAFGWHPQRIAVQLGEPLVTGSDVVIPVEMVFAAGNSLEDERQCVDAVNEQAQVEMTVTVQAISTGVGATTETIEHRQAFEYSGDSINPGEQAAPDLADRGVSVGFDGPIGWSGIDFRFHLDDPDGRGAYIRRMSFMLHEDVGAASGEATNFSPGTQLSGFDYEFVGSLSALPSEADVVRRLATDEVEIEMEGDAFVLQDIPLEAR